MPEKLFKLQAGGLYRGSTTGKRFAEGFGKVGLKQ